jgi:hypothetical protein
MNPGVSCISLLPFPISLHHSIDINYIDINIVIGKTLSDLEGTL